MTQPVDLRTCSVDGCDRPPRRKSAQWCNTHYFRWYRNGDPERRLIDERPKTCQIVGCDRPKKTNGLCSTHHARWTRHGDINAVKRTPRAATATYRKAHTHLGKDRGPASAHPCAHCAKPADDWAYDHSDPNELTSSDGPYSLDPGRYRPLCRSCHGAFDATHRATP